MIDDLIRNNLGLVYSQLIRFKLYNDADAESIAMEAIGNAAMHYNASLGYKFSTLATVYIYNALCGYIRKQRKKSKIDIVSYNDTIVLNGEEHEYEEVLESHENVEDSVVKKEEHQILMQLFDRILNSRKSEKQQRILNEWRNEEFNCNHGLIADRVGVSQSYVTQTITIFKVDLRRAMEAIYGHS